MAAPDFDSSLITTQDLSALTPDAMVGFAADCAETASRFFNGNSDIERLKGDLPDTVWTAIQAVRRNRSDIDAITGAREASARRGGMDQDKVSHRRPPQGLPLRRRRRRN